MFQSRKQLKERIYELESELKEREWISAFLDKTPLPKCKSLSCAGCEHVIYQRYHGRLFVCGCGKDIACQYFQKTDRSAEDQQLLREDLLERQQL